MDPASISAPAPTTASSSTTTSRSITQPSPIVQAWTTAFAPTVTLSSMTAGDVSWTM